MPSALTNVATASPADSATTATATGAAIITTRCRPDSPPSRDCSSSHSDTKPLPGGSAAAASAPAANRPVVAGIRADSPPSRSRSRSPVPCTTDPAEVNSSVLNAAWLRACRSPAPSATPASAGRSSAANVPQAATPRTISPAFSQVE